jgi:Transposase.
MPRVPDPELRRRWRDLIEQHRRSELTIADFCRRHEVSTAAFYQWRRRLREDHQPTPAFHPVAVRDDSPIAEPLTVRFDRGAVLEIPPGDSQSLTDVIEQLLKPATEAQP